MADEKLEIMRLRDMLLSETDTDHPMTAGKRRRFAGGWSMITVILATARRLT